MKQFDLVVVGAGPAGSSAAAAAATAGLSVLCVDKRVRCGEPVQCAEYVPTQVLSDTGLVSLVIQPVTHMRTTVEDDETRLSNFRGCMIDRAAFDQALLQQAEQSGAAIWLDTCMTGIDIQQQTVSLKSSGRRLTINFKSLVAADGPISRVAQQLGLPRQECAFSRQVSVPLSRPSSITETWLSRSFAGGYAWLFPKGRVANLGIGMGQRQQYRRPAALRYALQVLYQQLVEQGVVLSEVLTKTGGPIPAGGIVPYLRYGNVIFAGDAAGLAHPITGAGIAPAVMSGRMAGEAAAAAVLRGSDKPLIEYEQELYAIFEPSWHHALQQRKHVLKHANVSLRTGWVAFPEYYMPQAEPVNTRAGMACRTQDATETIAWRSRSHLR